MQQRSHGFLAAVVVEVAVAARRRVNGGGDSFARRTSRNLDRRLVEQHDDGNRPAIGQRVVNAVLDDERQRVVGDAAGRRRSRRSRRRREAEVLDAGESHDEGFDGVGVGLSTYVTVERVDESVVDVVGQGEISGVHSTERELATPESSAKGRQSADDFCVRERHNHFGRNRPGEVYWPGSRPVLEEAESRRRLQHFIDVEHRRRE